MKKKLRLIIDLDLDLIKPDISTISIREHLIKQQKVVRKRLKKESK